MVIHQSAVEGDELVQIPHTQDGCIQCVIIANRDEGVTESGVADVRDGTGVGLEAAQDAARCVPVHEEHLAFVITHDEGSRDEAAADDVQLR